MYQAAYVARLQQQAAQIKHLLKVLNNSSSNNSVNATHNQEESSKHANNADHGDDGTGGYESLWELSEKTLVNNVGDVETTTEVEEEDDCHDDNEDLYENTGIFANNFTLPIGELIKLSMSRNEKVKQQENSLKLKLPRLVNTRNRVYWYISIYHSHMYLSTVRYSELSARLSLIFSSAAVWMQCLNPTLADAAFPAFLWLRPADSADSAVVTGEAGALDKCWYNYWVTHSAAQHNQYSHQHSLSPDHPHHDPVISVSDWW